MNYIALVKGSERYILVYDKASVALQQLSNWANDSDLAFTWFDAALLAKKVRHEMFY